MTLLEACKMVQSERKLGGIDYAIVPPAEAWGKRWRFYVEGDRLVRAGCADLGLGVSDLESTEWGVEEI